jgi:hypothetical protein
LETASQITACKHLFISGPKKTLVHSSTEANHSIGDACNLTKPYQVGPFSGTLLLVSPSLYPKTHFSLLLKAKESVQLKLV